MNATERIVRDLCWQDEQTGGVKFSEEEIVEILNDKHPLILRMIRASFKQWELDKIKFLSEG